MSFVHGANLPWVRYGGDFGANAWAPEGGLATRPADQQRVLAVLRRLREAGVTRLRWFFLCDARAGIRFRGDGAPMEIQSAAWRDIDVALDLGATLIGVNNRNLETFEVDLATTERLAKRIPPGVVLVAESGIFTPDDVARLERAGASAFLVGESLMREADVGAALRNLRRIE